MHRSMMQVYVKESNKAFEFYQKAFDAKDAGRYYNSDGTTLAHSELDIYGQIFAVTELIDDDVITGNTMQFCLEFGEGKEEIVKKAYEFLKEDARKFDCLIGPCDWSPCMFSLVDKFGVHWCVFV